MSNEMFERAKKGGFPVVAKASLYYLARSNWKPLSLASTLALLGFLAPRFSWLATRNRGVGVIAGLVTIGLFSVGSLCVVGIATVRLRVTAQAEEVVIRGLTRTSRFPAGQIDRVFLRTVSYGGTPRREVIVVGKNGKVLARVLAAFFQEKKLREPFTALGFSPEGSWSDVVTLGTGFFSLETGNDSLALQLLYPFP